MKKHISFLLALLLIAGSLLAALPGAAASNAYVINGVTVHYDDYTSSYEECWAYANKFYQKIWGHRFNNKFDDSENSLRDLSDSELTLTEAHLKEYVSNAVPGSCLRVCNSKYLHANDGYGHSQLIVQIDANGFTVFEGGLKNAPHCREKYYTWSEYMNTSWLGKEYQYIKYIKWPDAPAYQPGFSMICQRNVSGKNYLFGTDLLGGTTISSTYYASRNTDVTTISLDTAATHNGYNSMKIVNKSAGSSGNDLMFHTLTNNRAAAGFIADNKEMTLSFWAKASNAGTKIYFRWGFESGYRSVSLTTEWAHYSVPMNKSSTYGVDFHPYVDRAGTVWLAELQLEDGTEATAFVPETYGAPFATIHEVKGGKYVLPATSPERAGYTFDGWYTAKVGGEKITTATTVKNGDINVYAHWKRINPFVDVTEDKYYYDAVLWAYYHDPQVANGADATHFSPKATCKREQVMTFLWNACGAPEPETAENPFTDVKSSKYYYKAVLWAVENGIATGTSPTTFGVGKECTRAQVMTFLWAAAGSPEPTSTENPFTDVKPTAYYYKAVLWAVESGVTTGTSATTFGPKATCTRGQIVTFLYAVYGQS